MKKYCVWILLVSFVAVLALGGCKSGNESNETASNDITLEFIGNGSNISVGEEITIPFKYEVDGKAGDTTNLVWSSSVPSVASVNGNKVKGISSGKAVITVSDGKNHAELTVIVTEVSENEKTIEEIIAELMADGYMSTTYVDTADTPVYAEEYAAMLNKRRPLEEGEVYAETFDKDYNMSRLYPEITVNGAQVSIKENVDGMDGKCLSITTDGDANGNYDAVVFKGFGLTPGARYRITLTAKTMTDGRNYYVGFRSDAGDKYAFNFSGTEGQLLSATGIITLGDTSYNGLVIMIAGGDSAELIIDNLTVERLIKLPEKDLTAIGTSAFFDFENGIEYASANNSLISVVTGEEAIDGASLKIKKTGNWQGVDFTDMKFASEGLYRVSFDIKLLSGSAGMAFATFSSAANGSYQDVGNQITILNTSSRFSGIFKLKNFDDYFFNLSLSDASCIFVIDNLKIECISEQDINRLSITEAGDKYTENFDGVSSEDDLEYFVKASSVITLVEEGTGKALQIKKSANWAGLNMLNIILKANGTYRVSFRMKLVSGSTDNMWATFSSAANGSYQDVGQKIVPGSEWTEFSLVYTLKDYDDYFFNFSFYDASAVVLLDDFTLEYISTGAQS